MFIDDNENLPCSIAKRDVYPRHSLTLKRRFLVTDSLVNSIQHSYTLHVCFFYLSIFTLNYFKNKSLGT
jgi:hypothetical protein